MTVTNSYPNPLDHFRSYSYQFIMTLSSTTEAFRSMIGTGDGSAPLFDIVNQAKTPGDELTMGNGQRAWLVMDTRRFSQYAVTDLNMEHIYGTGTAENPSVPANTTHMKLIDTTGLSFFNLLMDLFRNKMQSTRSSSFFLLTVLFVGHRDDGTTETVSTCFIPLMLLTMGFTLDFKGSEYEIDFMEVEGAPKPGASMEILNYMGSVQSITCADQQNTLEGMLGALEKQLNVESLRFYQKYSNDALQVANKAGNSSNKNVKPVGKLVQYMITVPEEWAKYKCSLAGRSKNVEQMFIAAKKATVTTTDAKAPTGKAKLQSDSSYAQMAFATTTSITDAIKAILESSLEILKEASEEKRKAGTARAFKTIMNITSDETSYVIHFDVFPYSLPKIEDPAKSTDTAQAATAQPGTKNVIGDPNKVHNLMTFDYMFTGKNSHIINLEIKYLPESAVALDTNVNIGGAAFASKAAQGQTANKSADAQKKTTSFSPDIRASDPIFMAYKTKDQQNNSVNLHTEELNGPQAIDALKSKQEFTQTYAYLHFLSSISLEMTIRGNPNLIRKYADRNTRGGIPPHVTIISATDVQQIAQGSITPEKLFDQTLAKSVSTAKAKYYADYVSPRIKGPITTSSGQGDPLLDGPDVSVEPVFCKINILAPNVDYTGDYKRGEKMFTDEFFYNGIYQVLLVQTNFSAGEFSHTLTLIPYDVSGTITQNDAGSTSPTKTG